MDSRSHSASQDAGGPPASVLAATSRFWIRSPDVAMGLVCGDSRDCRAWKTWKWNRIEGRCRETWLGDDRKLFVGNPLAHKSLSDPTISLITYKPESRIALKIEGEDGPVLRRFYPPKRFEFRAARAKAFEQAFSRAGMKLLKINPETQAIDWEWIDGEPKDASMGDPSAGGRPADASHIDPIAIGEVVDPESISPAALSDAGKTLPVIDARSIAADIKRRLAGAESWTRFLFPHALPRLRSIRSACSGLLPELETMQTQSPPVVLHGDLRPRNVIYDAEGCFRLCDADHVAGGPLEWDLAAWFADTARSGGAGETAGPSAGAIDEDALRGFAEATGSDPNALLLFVRAWRIIFDIADLEAPAVPAPTSEPAIPQAAAIPQTSPILPKPQERTT